MDLESDVQQELNEHRQAAAGHQRPAEDVEIPPAEIPQQRHHRGRQHPDGPRHRKGKRQEPMPAGGKVDIQQIQPDGRKVRRNKDHRVGPSEPQGQHRQDIQQQHAACGVPGPQDGPVDAPVAQDADDDGQHRQHGQDEQRPGAVHLLGVGRRLRREGGLPLLPGQIRMEHPGAAQRTHGLAVRQLHAAMDTIHG